MPTVGSTITNIFSSEFKITTSDGKNRFIQTFSDNMHKRTTPKISKNDKKYTEISFTPDYLKFGLMALDDVHTKLIQKRVSGVINVGSDAEISILDLAKKMHTILNQPFNPVFLPARPNDHARRKPDISLLKSLLPNIEFTDLDTGLKKMISFYQNRSS